jgi:ribokinase
VKVVVDEGTLREGSLDIARVSDCFIVSQSFARDLIGEDSPLDACRRLAEFGPSVVGVTLGAKGSVVLQRGRIIEQAAFKAKEIDTTGCGDIFHAGFAYGLLRDWDVEKCLSFASWAAAEVSMEVGGRAGIPRIDLA